MYFIDTTIVISYAVNFEGGPKEKHGKECEIFLKSNTKKVSSKNVKKEIESVRRKRTKLYLKLHQALLNNSDVAQLEVNDNVRKHFETIVQLMKKGEIEQNGEAMLRINQLFNSRIRTAVREYIEEFFDVNMEFEKAFPGYGYYKPNWDSLLGQKIGNSDDSKIIMDCIILSAIKGRIILVTLDFEHMLSKKDEINEFIKDYCSVIPSLSPDYDLLHITEVISTSSS